MGPKATDNSYQQPSDEGADPISPSSPVAVPARDDREDVLAASYQSTETVRRHPDASYGTMQSSTPTRGQVDSDMAPSSYQDRTYARVAAAAAPSPRPSPGISDRPRSSRPKKPTVSRRPSLNPLAPYRGEVFSVDDDIMEVEADVAEQQREQREQQQREQQREREREREQQQQGYSSRRRSNAAVTFAKSQSHIPPPEEDDHENRDAGGETSGQHDEDGHHSELQLEDHIDCEMDDDDELSDAESFTLKDRQQAINETHPFGIRLWKPALYKKSRSVQKTAEEDIHSVPSYRVGNWVFFFNVIWTLVFGWWMSLLAAFGAAVCFILASAPGARPYGRVLWGLSGYLFHPFGKVVHLEKDEAYLHEDRGEGRSIFEYERWQSDLDLEHGRLFFGPEPSQSIVGRSRRSIDSSLSETASLLGNSRTIERPNSADNPRKRRLFGRGEWNIGRVVFFFFFYFLIAPALIVVSLTCWFLVFWIPMGKVTMLLFSHLRRHPLALSFEPGVVFSDASHSSVLLCTYRAAGPRYWKYTIDGTNIFLINLMAVVVFVIFDWFVLHGILKLDSFLTTEAFLFPAGLLSIIPLAYFIGQAVASISAQSSMGLGAAINAFFSTVVEVYLYCIALNQGRGQLVEGSIVGSMFAGILFLPGLSMCFGAIKRKTQRFNAKSAGVTSTMLLFAVLGAFGPTLFYQIYGTHELYCTDCVEMPGLGDPPGGTARDCRRCSFSEVPSIDDRFYVEAVRPYCYVAAGALFLMYLVGLWFTLRTHAAVIWNTELDEKKHDDTAAAAQAARQQSAPHSFAETTGTDIRDSHLYKRILGQSLKQAGLSPRQEEYRQGSSATGTSTAVGSTSSGNANMASTPHVVPPKDNPHHPNPNVNFPGLSEAQNRDLVHQVAEMAATAATLAARDVRHPRRTPGRAGGESSNLGSGAMAGGSPKTGAVSSAPPRLSAFPEPEGSADVAGALGVATGDAAGGGHDAPNWGRFKSAVILLGATLMYAIIAEILVDSVGVVLNGFNVDEKFLGITLFALVPNTTEFLNAISFAMNGNIALSMEIGSAYALQVCMLQIPALVFYSAFRPPGPTPPPGVDMDPDKYDPALFMFSLLFPQFDMVTVIICVFLLSYMYGEGKSNYFKGSILLLSYLIVVVGFWLSDKASVEKMGMSRFDTMGPGGEFVSYGYKTVGRSRSGIAY